MCFRCICKWVPLCLFILVFYFRNMRHDLRWLISESCYRVILVYYNSTNMCFTFWLKVGSRLVSLRYHFTIETFVTRRQDDDLGLWVAMCNLGTSAYWQQLISLCEITFCFLLSFGKTLPYNLDPFYLSFQKFYLIHEDIFFWLMDFFFGLWSLKLSNCTTTWTRTCNRR